MTMESLRHFFAWCTLLNLIVLLFWAALTLWTPGFLRDMVKRWYGVNEEDFNRLNLGGIMYYELGIILFNFMPYLALRIMA